MLFKSILYLGSVAAVAAKVQFVGMNIAGFEFGCQIDGNCPLSEIQPPTTVGPSQMQHFATDDKMNIFRVPVSWQYLVNNYLGDTLNAANFAAYDKLIQSCLSTGAYCAIDLHNFGRFNGTVIGQGGPTDAQFADLWSQLATKYKSSSKLIFGLMNEPHDLDVPIWANTIQAAVTAIRKTGATSQMILLPGTSFASAGNFVSSGSAAALTNVTNPDGSVDGLILDLHKYLDVDNSGSHAECVTDNIANAFAIAAAFLRENGRQGLVSETGAGHSAASCFTDFAAQNTFLNQNADVFLGYIAWSAGSFPTSYVLGLTPTQQDGKFVDHPMVSQCVLAPWNNAGAANATSATSMPSTTSSSRASSVTSGVSSSNGTSATTIASALPASLTSASGSTSITTGPVIAAETSISSAGPTAVPTSKSSASNRIVATGSTLSMTAVALTINSIAHIRACRGGLLVFGLAVVTLL